jgi:anti-sigma B factor antagonist
MQFSSSQLADVTLAVPVGRIDQTGAPALEQALSPLVAQAGAEKGAIVLDFSGVDYISSVGLRVLMIASKAMRQHGARIVLAAPQPVVAEILSISRFDRVLEIAPAVRRALEWVSGPALKAYEAGTGAGARS